MAGLPKDRRRRVEARAEELVSEEMSLRALRRAMGKTQAAMARKLGVKQENISRLEARADMLLSTLGGFVRAAGGSLHLVVEFEDRAPVRLADLAAIGAAADAPRVRKCAYRSAPAVPKQRNATRGGTHAKQPAAARSAAAKKPARISGAVSAKRSAAAGAAPARGRASA